MAAWSIKPRWPDGCGTATPRRPSRAARISIALLGGSVDEALKNGETLASIDARMNRLGQRFEWGHIDEADYRAEWDRLQAARKQLTDGDPPRRRIRLGGVLEAWQAGDSVSRRDLLATLFDDMDVRDGQIVAVKPRSNLVAEVSELIDHAYGDPPLTGSESLLGVGREGFEPPQLSRVVYSHLSSPMPSRPTVQATETGGSVTEMVPVRPPRPGP
jgi:hypothetical protein